MRLARILSCTLFALAGCSSTVRSSVTRVLGAPASQLAGYPICFSPPAADASLTERAEYGKMHRACESAVVKRDLRVGSFANGGCLVATMTWSTGDTGARQGTCERNLFGAECESNAIHLKSLKVALGAPGQPTIAETTASIYSSFGGFNEHSYFALCSAAFHDYPQQLSNEKLDVDTE